MQKQRKAKPAKRSSFQEGHIQIGYAIDLSKGKHADELKVKKCTHAKASSMEKSPNEAPFWRERGTDACRWIVDTPMLEQRKTYGCNKYPFYKNFPHPPRTSYLLPRTCLFIGKHANVLSSFSLKGSRTGFRSDRLNHLTVCRLLQRSAWWKVEYCM